MSINIELPPLHNGLKEIQWVPKPSGGYIHVTPQGLGGQMEIFDHIFRKPDSTITAVCAGRRFGKTRLAVISALFAVLRWERPVSELSQEVVVAVMPTMRQAIKVIWPSLCATFGKIPTTQINNSHYYIQVPNRPRLILSGAEKGDRLRGLRISFALLDEFQGFRPQIWYEVIRPAMADTPGSRALITGTPKPGKVNIFYKVAHSTGVTLFQAKTKDNPYIARHHIELARATLPPKVFRQEMEGSFMESEGAIYSEYSDTENVVPLAPTEYQRAYLGIDWGDVHPAYCVVLVKGGEFFIVEAKTVGDGRNAVPEAEFLKVVAAACQRWKVYRVYAPPERPAAIKQCRIVGSKNPHLAGMARTVEAHNAVAPGIQAVHTLFYQRRLKVVKGLEDFRDEIQSYHRRPHPVTDEYIPDSVARDQPDHTLDALRYVIYSLLMRLMKRDPITWSANIPFIPEVKC